MKNEGLNAKNKAILAAREKAFNANNLIKR